MASLRYERRIAATVDAVWDVVRRPESIPNWFPGIVSCTVEGESYDLADDPLQRVNRFDDPAMVNVRVTLSERLRARLSER